MHEAARGATIPGPPTRASPRPTPPRCSVKTIPIAEVRSNLQSVMFFVSEGRNRVVLVDGDEERGALISLDDLAMLEALSRNGESAIPRVTPEEFRTNIREVVRRDARVILCDENVDIIAVVPKRDVEALESLDGKIDLEAAKQNLEQQMDES